MASPSTTTTGTVAPPIGFEMNSRFFLVLYLTVFPIHAATRVALVSTCDRRSVENALALAEADLGHGDGLELVERAEIEKVLGEQETCELFDGGRAVTV